jgi:hypothetical protein
VDRELATGGVCGRHIGSTKREQEAFDDLMEAISFARRRPADPTRDIECTFAGVRVAAILQCT